MSNLNYRKIFVHNIDYNMRKQEVESEFARFGKIEKC